MELEQFLTKSKIFLLLCISFILGVFLAEEKIYFISYLLVIFLSGVFIFFIYKNLRFKISILIILSILFTFIGFWRYQKLETKYEQFNKFLDKEVKIIGWISEEPEIKENQQKIKIEIFTINSQKLNPTLNVLLTTRRYPEYFFGQTLLIEGNLKTPPVFEKFSYKNYLKKERVVGIINYPKITAITEIPSPTNRARISKFIFLLKSELFKLKNKLINTTNQILPEPFAALLLGLLFGLRTGLPKSLLDTFAQVGITHIIALSGFNITIIIGAFAFLTQNLSKKLSFILGSLGILLFVILVGGQPSIVRAAIMGWLFLLAPLFGRKGNITNILIFTAALMIFANPFILRWDTSFQLSFLAVLGLVYLSPIFSEKLNLLPKFIKEPISLTLGAQIFSLPILLFTFGRFSLISPLPNTLILPFIPLTMLLGSIAICLGLIYLKIGIIFGFLAWFLLNYIIKTAEIFSKFPFVSWKIEKFSGSMVALYFLILVYLLFRFYHRKKLQNKSL